MICVLRGPEGDRVIPAGLFENASAGLVFSALVSPMVYRVFILAIPQIPIYYVSRLECMSVNEHAMPCHTDYAPPVRAIFPSPGLVAILGAMPTTQG